MSLISLFATATNAMYALKAHAELFSANNGKIFGEQTFTKQVSSFDKATVSLQMAGIWRNVSRNNPFSLSCGAHSSLFNYLQQGDNLVVENWVTM